MGWAPRHRPSARAAARVVASIDAYNAHVARAACKAAVDQRAEDNHTFAAPLDDELPLLAPSPVPRMSGLLEDVLLGIRRPSSRR